MEKSKILSKLNIDIKDYNNELEKILENKLFSYDVKNLLLSMLYKIENAYKDYETVNVEVPSKREYIENLFNIIKEKCLKILLVKAGTPEAEDLEKNNLLFKVDRKNGEIVCFQNELVILIAILNLDTTQVWLEMPYQYMEAPIFLLLKIGKIDSEVQVIRDFNGWSWDIDRKKIKDIEYNYIYQTMLLLNGRKGISIKNQKKLFNLICKMAIKKYLSEANDLEYNDNFEKLRKQKQERLKLFDNKKEFINHVSEEKKNYTKEIENIDRILNNNELLKKEYYARNEKLPNKQKIFSVSYLVGILDKERADLIQKIDECNRIILPKEFVEQKSKLEEEVKFLNDILEADKDATLIELATEFLEQAKSIILKINEEHKRENGELRQKVKELERVIDRGWLVYTEKLENQIPDLKSLNRKKILELKQNGIPKQVIEDKIEELRIRGNYKTFDNPDGRIHFLKEETDYKIEALKELLQESEDK